MGLRSRVRDAAEDGIVLGVKWAIVVALTLLGASYAVSDYAVTKAKADHGEQAAQFIQKQIDAANAATKGATLGEKK